MFINTIYLITSRLSLKVRTKKDLPFGGLVVVVAADFLQLHPADWVNEAEMRKKLPKRVVECDYAFKSRIWQQNPPKIFYLKENKQFESVDLEIIKALRRGDLEFLQHCPKFISLCCNDRLTSDDIREQEVYLVPFSGTAERLNNEKLTLLQSESNQKKYFNAIDTQYMPDSYLDKLVVLCVGVQIVFLGKFTLKSFTHRKSVDVFKGTLGRVTKINSTNVHVEVYGENGEYVVEKVRDGLSVGGFLQWSRTQLPIRLAFYMSIRSAHDLSIEGAILDMEPVEDYRDSAKTLRITRGMVYCAFGNLRGFSGMKAIKGLLDQNRVLYSSKLTASQEALIFDDKAVETCEIRKELLAGLGNPNPGPASQGPSVTEAPVILTQQIQKVIELVEETNKNFKRMIDRGNVEENFYNRAGPGAENERAAYTNFAAATWNSRISSVRPNDDNRNLVREDDDEVEINLDEESGDSGPENIPDHVHNFGSDDVFPKLKLVASDIESEDRDPFDIFDVEAEDITSDSEHDEPQGPARPVRPRADVTANSRRSLPEDAELITAASYEGRTETQVCPYNPNKGGVYLLPEEKRIWSDRPFLKIHNVGSRKTLIEKVRAYLGPLPTSGEEWQWNLDERTKPSTQGYGQKFYCEFGGRALRKSKLKPREVRLFNRFFFCFLKKPEESETRAARTAGRPAKTRAKANAKSRQVE